MRETVRLIGKAIRAGSTYLPLRNHAAALATMAGPKDYLGQARNIFDDVLKRWRYVKDPVSRELLTYGPKRLWEMVLAGDGIGVGAGKGAGDCDCVSAATGALLEAIGHKVRIATTAPPNAPPGRMYSHVFVQTFVPGRGWITVDPVVHPKHGFGHTPAHSRIAVYDLDGRQIGQQGNTSGPVALNGSEDTMTQLGQLPDLTQWQDYGLGDDGTNQIREPEDWRAYGLPNFGAYSERLGILDGQGLGLAAEVTPQLYNGRVLARTPLLELTPKDYRYVSVMKQPYDGMLALGDDAAIYEFDGSLGFFKRLWGGIKKVGRKIAGGVRKIVSKIPGGKYLIKLGKKVWSIAKKFVRPLARFVGKYAAKLAPVAALIPGYGPAIAAGLYTAGKIANVMNKYDVAITGAAGKVRKLKFKSGDKAKRFQKALKKLAKKEARRQKRGGKIKPMRGKRRGRRKDRSKRRTAPEMARPRIMGRQRSALRRMRSRFSQRRR